MVNGYLWMMKVPSHLILKKKPRMQLQLGKIQFLRRKKLAHQKRTKRLLKKHRLQGVNKPKRTPSHSKKSHIVLAKVGHKVKLIRFGQQGAKTAGKPKAGESTAMKRKRASFKARHRKNIARGKMSAAYWANRVKW